MKKKTLGLLAAILSVCMLAGCGAKDTGDGTGAATDAGTESTALKDMDVDKYVTLGEYKGLAVSVDTVEVDEDEIVDIHTIEDAIKYLDSLTTHVTSV